MFTYHISARTVAGRDCPFVYVRRESGLQAAVAAYRLNADFRQACHDVASGLRAVRDGERLEVRQCLMVARDELIERGLIDA